MSVACRPDMNPTSPDVGFFSSPRRRTMKSKAGDVDNSIDIWKRPNGFTSVLEEKDENRNDASSGNDGNCNDMEHGNDSNLKM